MQQCQLSVDRPDRDTEQHNTLDTSNCNTYVRRLSFKYTSWHKTHEQQRQLNQRRGDDGSTAIEHLHFCQRLPLYTIRKAKLRSLNQPSVEHQ